MTQANHARRLRVALTAATLTMAAGLTLARSSASCDQDKSAHASAKVAGNGCAASASCPASMCGARGARVAANHSAACSAACKTAKATTAVAATSKATSVSPASSAGAVSPRVSARRAHGARARHAAPAKRAASTTSAANVIGGGMIGAVDPETGRLVAPTASQIRELAAQARAQKSAGSLSALPELRTIRLANGTKVMPIVDDRLTSYATVQLDAQRKQHMGCTRDPNTIVTAAAPAAAPSAGRALESTTPAVER